MDNLRRFLFFLAAIAIANTPGDVNAFLFSEMTSSVELDFKAAANSSANSLSSWTLFSARVETVLFL